MQEDPKTIEKVYLLLMLLSTLAASFIWGINTIFLLDAGLTNAQAFGANAFFTLGEVIFQVPTGIVADSLGRRTSYILGTLTLAVSTILYLLGWMTHAHFWVWAATSIFLGLGFTFFSGATEAWLVDALHATKFKGSLESVFAKGQIVGGVAMLVGSVAGGLIAQVTNLGVPYILRALVLVVTFVVAFIYMRDVGFKPVRSKNMIKDMKRIFLTSIKSGLGKPAIRWVMLFAPFSMGVSIYVFYASQPYLLQLYGNSKAYGIAGLTAAIVAGAQILGGLTASYIRKFFKRRTTMFVVSILISTVALLLLGVVSSFWIAIFILVIWGLVFAANMPIRQAYLNGLIESSERATVLSFDSLVGSSGGVVFQPILGKVADVWNYPASYLVSALIQVFGLPFALLARREKPASDIIENK